MKLGPVTKFGEINTAMSKKFHDKTMPKKCTVIKIFLKYGQFGAIQKLDSGQIGLTFALTVTFYCTKTEIGTGKFLTQLSYYCFQ